jgi:hypothetical protein
MQYDYFIYRDCLTRLEITESENQTKALGFGHVTPDLKICLTLSDF